jgi:peptidoglycan-N-acetylglucosamine deacetylase
MQLWGGGSRGQDLFARIYFAVFVMTLVASVPLSGANTAVASRSARPTTTAPTSTTAAAAAPPVTAPPVAPSLALGPDMERRLPVATAPDGRAAVTLTFDDGPHPYFTPRVLDVLASRNVKAVFCVVGTEVARYPHLVARIAAEGHALCNHTHTHDTRMSRKDPHYVASMLRHPSNLIRDITGQMPTFYRGPGGDLSVFIIEEAHRLGMRILGWSVDPADYFKPGGQAIQDRIMRLMHPGAIVLLHDGGGERSQTVEQLAGLIDRLAAGGYTFVLP